MVVLLLRELMVRLIEMAHYDRNLVMVVVVMAVRTGRGGIGHRNGFLFDYRPTGGQLQGLRHLLLDRVQNGLWQ